jgi:hypothetical protein
MRICDKCGCEDNRVTAIVYRADLIDICPSCKASFARVMAKASRKAAKLYWENHGNFRAAAYHEWQKSDGGMRAKARRMYLSLAAMVDVLMERNRP